jgi:hypothetical protein
MSKLPTKDELEQWQKFRYPWPDAVPRLVYALVLLSREICKQTALTWINRTPVQLAMWEWATVRLPGEEQE